MFFVLLIVKYTIPDTQSLTNSFGERNGATLTVPAMQRMLPAYVYRYAAVCSCITFEELCKCFLLCMRLKLVSQ